MHSIAVCVTYRHFNYVCVLCVLYNATIITHANTIRGIPRPICETSVGIILEFRIASCCVTSSKTLTINPILFMMYIYIFILISTFSDICYYTHVQPHRNEQKTCCSYRRKACSCGEKCKTEARKKQTKTTIGGGMKNVHERSIFILVALYCNAIYAYKLRCVPSYGLFTQNTYVINNNNRMQKTHWNRRFWWFLNVKIIINIFFCCLVQYQTSVWMWWPNR